MDFELVSSYKPTGDQPEAIETLAQGIREGVPYQTLLGVTGSGKTFTMGIFEEERVRMLKLRDKMIAQRTLGD